MIENQLKFCTATNVRLIQNTIDFTMSINQWVHINKIYLINTIIIQGNCQETIILLIL